MTTSTTVLRVHLFAGWDAAQTATVIAALVAVTGVMATILATSARGRREQKADLYANALGGVADYLEGPYRIRRKDGTSAHRNTITAAISDVKSAIDHSQELLRLHAPRPVADAYDDYVLAAKVEAGQQMKEAWNLPPVKTDAEVSIDTPYPRDLSAEFRTQTVRIMQADLARRSWNPWRLARFLWCTRRVLTTPRAPTLGPDKPVSESETP